VDAAGDPADGDAEEDGGDIGDGDVVPVGEGLAGDAGVGVGLGLGLGLELGLGLGDGVAASTVGGTGGKSVTGVPARAAVMKAAHSLAGRVPP